MTITYKELLKLENHSKKVIITYPQKEYEEIIKNVELMQSKKESINLDNNIINPFSV